MDFLKPQMWAMLLLASIILLWLKRRANSSPKRLPPGPTPLPFIGNLLSLDSAKKPHKCLSKLASKYGAIMTLKLGSVTTIILSSPTLAKEVFQEHDLALSTPFVPSAARAYQHDQFSVAWLPSSSTKWRTLRRIFKTQLFNNKRLDTKESLCLQEVLGKLMDYIRKSAKNGVSINISEEIRNTSFNFMLGSIFSMDSSHSSSREILDLVCCITKEVGTPNLSDYFPLLQMVNPQGIRYRLTVLCSKLFEVFDAIIDKRLDERKENFSSNTPALCTNDLLGTLLDIMEAENHHHDRISRLDVLHLILDLFGAGIDTTSVTLEWAMTELIRNAPVMKKAQEEIDKNIGNGKEQFGESDITRLPYLQAIVKETFRLHPAAPLLLPRKAQHDIDICGFTIPKGSQVLVNSWAIGRHPDTWPDPDSFVPERFMDSEVDVKGQHFGLIPFGAGRRICPGLPSACRTFPVVLASLISSFNWELADTDMDMDDEYGITLKKSKPLIVIPSIRN